MKNLKNLVALSLLVFVFSGCESFQGNLKVSSDFAIQNHHILPRTITYSPGSYAVNLTYHSIEGLLEVQGEGHSEAKFKFSKSYIEHGGAIDIKGTDIGEAWDVQGNFAPNQITQSAPFPSTQSCILRYDTVTTWTPVQRCFEGRCHTEQVPVLTQAPVYGSQNIIVQTITVTRTLNLKFISTEAPNAVVAELTGDNSVSNQVVNNVTSPCL